MENFFHRRIAADEGRFKSNNEVIINTETRSVEVNKKGIYFAFRDEGACISLLAIKVNLAFLPTFGSVASRNTVR